MNRIALSRRLSPSLSIRRGYTLVEILVATTLSLMILGAVVQLFGTVGTSITQSRSIMEAADRLRATQNLLQSDLEGLTVTPIPPRRTEFNEGYLEIIKGPIVQTQTGPLQLLAPNLQPLVTTDGTNRLDTSVGALGNILMFTTRTKGKPFVGRQLVPDFSDTSHSRCEMQVGIRCCRSGLFSPRGQFTSPRFAGGSVAWHLCSAEQDMRLGSKWRPRLLCGQ